MRLRRGALAPALVAALLGAAAEAGERVVRLDRAALEALRSEDPERWRQLRDILAAQRWIEDEALAGCLRAKFGADAALRSGVLLTTQPPQRRLSFALGGVRHEGLVAARFRTRPPRLADAAQRDPCAPPAPRTYEVVE